MRMVDIIERKRDGYALSEEEIRFFVKGYVDGDIPDYQASAFAMAVLFRGMESEEIAWLTDAMMHSGKTIDLSSIAGVKVDKHSTGGVGDKTSLVVGPLVASCGAKVAKGKFCLECGAPLIVKCKNCNKDLAPGAKFCPECGTKAE